MQPECAGCAGTALAERHTAVANAGLQIDAMMSPSKGARLKPVQWARGGGIFIAFEALQDAVGRAS